MVQVDTSMTLRPFEYTGHDYDQLRRLEKAALPHRPLETMDRIRFKHEEVLKRATAVEHFVVWGDGRLNGSVAVMKPWWFKSDDLMLIQIYVHPGEQGQGLGSRLLSHAVQGARRHGCARLGGHTYDRYPGSVSFMANRGFKSVQSNARSLLDIGKALPETLWESHERVIASGIEIIDGEALAKRFPDDWKQRWWRLAVQLQNDVPMPEPRESDPFDTWIALLEFPGFDLRYSHFAVDDDNMVGVTGLMNFPADPGFAGVTFTGTLASHRRRGIGMALKLVSIRSAKALGVTCIMAENEANNPMLNINLLLGFKVDCQHILYQADREHVAEQLEGRMLSHQ